MTFVLLALPLGACLSSPLGQPGQVALDSHLLGDWNCRPGLDDSTETATLEILRFDESQYLAEWKEDDKTTRYRAFPTSVKGVRLINLTELGGGQASEPWLVVRYRVGPDESLAVDFLEEKILEMDEKAILHALKKRPGDPSLWRPFVHCVPNKS
jgi:hypothetical protein